MKSNDNGSHSYTPNTFPFFNYIGLVSQEIASHTKSLVGIDVSEKSVEMFNETVANQGIDPSEMKAFCLDVFDTKGMEAKLGGRKFDLVYSSMTYHHVKDVVGTTKILAGLAKPGGRVVLVDLSKLERYEGKFHGKDSCSSVVHRGEYQVFKQEKNFSSPLYMSLENLLFLGFLWVHTGGFTAEEFQSILESSGLVDVHVDRTAFTLLKPVHEKHNHGGGKGHGQGEGGCKGGGEAVERMEEFEFLLGQGKVPV